MIVSNPLSFIVKNVSLQKKTIRIFINQIAYGQLKDLMQIPGVFESDIRNSLLKGELRQRLINKDIIIINSDVNLVQFNDEHLSFLHNNNIKNGTIITYKNENVIHYENQTLIGIKNSINTTFKIANSTFIQNNIYNITVLFNGIRQVLTDDYIVAEGNGVGTGYDTIVLFIAPEFDDIIIANYYVYQYG